MRIKTFLILTLILLMMPLFVTAQEPGWLMRLKQQEWMNKVSQLKLLKTTRAEVEKILGEPDKFDFKTADFIQDYSLNNGRATLHYTTKECTSTDGNIAKNSVEEIYFSLEDNISFSKLVSDLKIPLKEFKHSGEGDNGNEHYENEQYGIDITVQSNKVESIEFAIPERKKFSCVTIPSFLKDLSKIKELKLLKANRVDVRKIFADYEFRQDNQAEYNSQWKYKEWFNTTSAKIEFTYSEGKCWLGGSDGYDSAEWNVESVEISPVNYIDPKDFGIDLSKYKKEKVYNNIPDFYVYHDKALGISFQVRDGEIGLIIFFPSQKYNSLMCDQERAKILSSTKSLFTEKLKDRLYYWSGIPHVEKLHLSQSEIITGCHKTTNKSCSDYIQPIKVFTRAKDPDGDTLVYSYAVSGGKIIGRGAEVLWDLSGVKTGTYTITASVDDGCGFCGKGMTKTVVVRECSDCK